MSYAPEFSESLVNDCEAAAAELEHLQLALVRAGSGLSDGRSREHLTQGAGRRLRIIKHCLTTIFSRFPPSLSSPLSREDLNDVQIAHHAFVVNLYGYFENLAWSFVLRHGLEHQIGGKKKIGLFLKSTRAVLPEPIRAYLSSTTMVAWHDKYLKNYRDALAHRVPLYIPPAVLTNDEVIRAQTLQEQERDAILGHQWELLEEVRTEQQSLGRPCLFFAHSFNDTDDRRPIYLHPQTLCDVKTVLEFTPLYLQHWHERV